MEDKLPPPTHRLRNSAGPVLAALIACGLAGCSLFVMAGKMLYGDPRVTCSFRNSTRVDLTKGKKKLLLVCSAPESVESEISSIKYDLLEGVAHRLRREGIQLVSPGDVFTWLDNNAGWSDASDLAAEFDADYIAHIDLEQFTYHEDSSPGLYRGQAAGKVFVYEVRRSGGEKVAEEVARLDFKSVYPEHHPIEVSRRSSRTFLHEYVGRVSTKLSQMFYDYHMSETVY